MRSSGIAEGERPRVLLVDDDAALLRSVERVLRSRFDVVMATSGRDGLRALAEEGPFAVLVVDCRMPHMDGPSFLAYASQADPDATRLMFTGAAQLHDTVTAINHGQVFRIVFKPGVGPDFVQAIDAAVAQHRLVVGERRILEQTLQGAVKALVDGLACLYPATHASMQRVRRLALDLERRVFPRPDWALHLALTVWPIGALALPLGLVERAIRGEPLLDDELAQLASLHEATARLLTGIPRLERVLEIIRAAHPDVEPDEVSLMPEAARLIRLAIAYDRLEAQRLEPDAALAQLRTHSGLYGDELLDALAERIGGTPRPVPIEVAPADLIEGMILVEEVRSAAGVLMIAPGAEITPSLLRWFRRQEGQERHTVRVIVPPNEVAGQRTRRNRWEPRAPARFDAPSNSPGSARRRFDVSPPRAGWPSHEHD